MPTAEMARGSPATALTGGYTQVNATLDAFLEPDKFKKLPDEPPAPFLASGQEVLLVSFARAKSPACREQSWRGHRGAREGLVLGSEGPLGQQRTFMTTHGEVSAVLEKVLLGI